MFSLNVPPGLLYILDSIPHLAQFLLPVYVAYHLLAPYLPKYVWVAVYVLVVPAVTISRAIYRYVLEEREIRRLGAQRVPQVPARLPGSLDVFRYVVETMDKGYIGEAWEGFSHNLGPTFNARLLWEDLIVTTEPEHLKAILATDFENYEKGHSFRWCMQSVLGTGVFNSDGDRWRFHRGVSRPFFARERVMHFDLFDRHADTAISKLKERFAQGEAVNFQDIVSRFTLDTATEFLFGTCVHSLSAPLAYAHNSPRRKTLNQSHASDVFSHAFNSAQTQLAKRAQYGDLWQLSEFGKDETRDSMDIINAYIDPILKDALAKKGTVQPRSPIGETNDDYTLLDHLIRQTDDPVILRDETLNIMIAGRDTTTATLTFLFYCLSQYPNVLARLREEILTNIGHQARPTFDDMRECKYLRAVINETLRLYPPVPFNIRRSVNATTWPAPAGGKPFYIPAGVEISYSVWLMHRRTDLWGPDAHKFDPDRFLDYRRDKYLTPNPFIFLPFNAGPRICLGQQFAYHEASFMTVRLLQTFDTVTFAPDAHPPEKRPSPTWRTPTGEKRQEKVWPKSHLTLYSYGGMWLRMGEARSTDVV